MSASTGFTITLGKTSKRVNSTSQSFSGTAYTGCFLKENTSINNPVIILNAPLDKYNYMSWGSRYYWVDETISIDWKRIEIHCHLDPLATYKSSILSHSVYALYAEGSSNWNQFVDDVRIQPEKYLYGASFVKNQVFGDDVIDSDGCVVMTFFQAIPSYGVNPGIHTAVMTTGNFHSCLEDISSIQWDQGITEFLELFTKTIQAFAGNGSWADNVYSCIWLPVNYSKISGTVHTGLAIGGLLADNVTWKEIPQNFMIKNASNGNRIDLSSYWSTTLPENSKAFLRNARFTSAQLVTPSGAVSVDTSSLMQIGYLQISAVLNVGNGDWCLRVHGGTSLTDEVLATASGNLGINLMGLVVDSPDLLSQGVQSVFNLSMGAAVTAVASEYGSKTGIDPGNLVASPVVHRAPSCPMQSSNAGMFLSSSPGQVMFNMITMGPQNIGDYTSFCNKHGYPANKMISLSGYSGFLKCFNASIGCSGASQADEAFINTCMNSGIYIE